MGDDKLPDGFYFHWRDLKMGASGPFGIAAMLAVLVGYVVARHFGWL